jgi:hypothetical protein
VRSPTYARAATATTITTMTTIHIWAPLSR